MENFALSTGLMVAVPLTGRPLPPAFTWAYANLHPPMCYNVIYATNFDQNRKVIPMLVDQARNWFCEQAIANKCKYIFFIDEDVTPPPHTLRQLIFQMEHHPEAAIIGGIYCHKAQPPMPMVFRGNGSGPYWDWKAGEFFEVSGIGMGCTLVRVDALAKIEKPWFKTVDNMERFWDGDPKAETWTEDLYFAKKITDAGMKIYADSMVLAEHWDMRTMEPTTLPDHCLPLRRMGIKRGDKKIVDLGCGRSHYETDEGQVLRVDIRDDVGADYRCDLRKLPFGTGEFDIVFSSHTLEHFDRKEVPLVLDEWIRILKPEGEFRIILPNIAWAAARIANGEIPDNDMMNVIYGEQSYNENYHKFCFTPQVLTDMLKERGFVRLDIELQGYNIYCRGWRVQPEGIPPLGEQPDHSVVRDLLCRRKSDSDRAVSATPSDGNGHKIYNNTVIDDAKIDVSIASIPESNEIRVPLPEGISVD